MKCQCIICQELFENTDDEVISALECGHTFHNACLEQWLENGRTCPSCRCAVNRKKIIQRLYFDAPEDAAEEVDNGKLQNELDRLKLEIRKKEKEKNDSIKEKEAIVERLDQVENVKKATEKKLKQEQSANGAHLKTLRYYESQKKSLETEREECRKIKQKMVMLQTCDTLLNGCESEAAEILSNTGDGAGAVQNLSRQVAFLKREYEKLKHEKKYMKEDYDKVMMKDGEKNKKLKDLKKECETLKEQLERSEGDLKISEREVEFLRKTNHKLKRVLRSPSTSDKASASFTKIMNESDHMNMFTASTPKLGNHVNSDMIDLDETPDLFESPVKAKSPGKNIEPLSNPSRENSPILGKKKSLKRPLTAIENSDTAEMQVKYLKTSSIAEKHSQAMKKFKSESSISDVNSLSTISGMNIFKKRTPGEGTSIIRKGYDGLGGHTTFVNSQGGSKNIFKKPVVGKSKLSQLGKPPSTGTLTSLGFSVSRK